MDLDFPTDEPLDLSLKNSQDPKPCDHVVPEKPQDNPLDLSHPKRHNVEQLKKPYLASRNFKPVSNPKNTFILIIHQLFSLSAGPAA